MLNLFFVAKMSDFFSSKRTFETFSGKDWTLHGYGVLLGLQVSCVLSRQQPQRICSVLLTAAEDQPETGSDRCLSSSRLLQSFYLCEQQQEVKALSFITCWVI